MSVEGERILENHIPRTKDNGTGKPLTRPGCYDSAGTGVMFAA